MNKPPLYKPENFSELFSLLGKISDALVKLATSSSLLGILYQIIVLGNLNYIAYFSWTQVINDTIVIGTIIFIVYQSYVRGLDIYEKYFYNKENIKGTICAGATLICVLIAGFLVYYFLHNRIPIIVSLVILMMSGFVFSFLNAFSLHGKQQEHGLESKNFGDLSSWFNLGLLVIVFSVIYAYHKGNYEHLEVIINNETYSVKYMNDIYIITENGVFDRDGNRFYSSLTGNEILPTPYK